MKLGRMEEYTLLKKIRERQSVSFPHTAWYARAQLAHPSYTISVLDYVNGQMPSDRTIVYVANVHAYE